MNGVKVQQSNRANSSKGSKKNYGTWTKEMPVLAMVIDGNALHVIQADHLSKFFTPGNLCDEALIPL
jgi:hypothetical protein